ncbi:hypothetical protein ElyMa_004869600 [Elysia marginata]|uniref:Uncharacterized protein n=1 Tax=Elysia marginata TaxID=1093978 RepID=A0AAV4IRB3_9GAST|nr:hypothetical protein ElyMa_004869600 [Elysia marginata]
MELVYRDRLKFKVSSTETVWGFPYGVRIMRDELQEMVIVQTASSSRFLEVSARFSPTRLSDWDSTAINMNLYRLHQHVDTKHNENSSYRYSMSYNAQHPTQKSSLLQLLGPGALRPFCYCLAHPRHSMILPVRHRLAPVITISLAGLLLLKSTSQPH